MKNTKWKKAQRRLNKDVRQINHLLQTDDFLLKKGDFEIRQIVGGWSPFCDGSGGLFDVLLRITERRSGKSWDKVFYDVNYAGFFGWHLFVWVNNILGEYE